MSAFLCFCQSGSRSAAVAAVTLGLLCQLGCSSDVVVDPVAAERGPASVSTQEPARYSCELADAREERPMLAARVNNDVHLVYRNRTVNKVFSFAVPDDGYIIGQAPIIARGDLVAAAVVIAPRGGADTFPTFAELVVIDMAGGVQLQQRYDFRFQGANTELGLSGNANGLFVMTFTETNASLGIVVQDGETTEFEQRIALRSDPDPAGRMVVWNTDASSTADLAFFDALSRMTTPARYLAGEQISSPIVLNHGIVYLNRSPARLLSESADGIGEQALDVTLGPASQATAGTVHSGNWILFMLGGQTARDARYLATNVATGKAREFRLEPPPSWELPQDFWNPPAIDSTGRLLVVLSSGSAWQLHTTIDGVDWEPVGRSIEANGFGTKPLLIAGDAVVFDAFNNPAQLVGPQGGDGFELVRDDVIGDPSNPTDADDVLSPDGSCLAYFKNGSLQVVESDSYAQTDLGIESTTQSASAAWIPLSE